jgi:2'-5' RNA ligase
MSQQFSFAEFAKAPAAPRSPGPLFFALFPDAETAVRIAELSQRLKIDLGVKRKPIPTDRLHVTLYFLGDFPDLPEDIIDVASAAADSLTTGPFDVVFDRVVSFTGRPGNRPLVLRGDEGLVGLTKFQGELAMAIRRGRVGRSPKTGFTPHVTLLYDDAIVTEQAVEDIRWTVQELVLVHSDLDQHRHVHLARWPLIKMGGDRDISGD